MNLQVGVKIIAKQGNTVLLLRRTQESTKELWDIPGGRINTDEPLLDALSRELFEETGMKLLGQPKLVAAQDIFVSAKNLHVVRLTYTGSATGDVTVSDEHDSFLWLDSDALLEFDGLDPYLLEALKRDKDS